MNASAFCDIWAQVIFFKFSKLHELQASAIWELQIEMHTRAIIQFFIILYILNKILKRREEKPTIMLLYTWKSVMASKLLTCSIKLTTATKNEPKIVLCFASKHKFYSNWKLSKLGVQEKICIVLYNVFMLSSLANQKWDILLSIL